MGKRMISQYIAAILGLDLTAEVIEGTLTLTKPGCYHIYLKPEEMLFIGTITDKELPHLQAINARRKQLLDIYNSYSTENETV